MAKRKKASANPVAKKRKDTQTHSVNLSHRPELRLRSGFWKDFWLPALLLFIVAMAPYFQSLDYDYVLDDKIVLTENNYVKKGISGISEILFTESFQGYFGEQKDLVTGARYRPLSIITFALEHQFFGLNKQVSHGVNIFLYGLTVLLLFRVLMMLFPVREDNHWWLGIAFVATLLFAVHPVHTEVVANVKGRDEIMALLGSLATLYTGIRYFNSGKIGWVVASGVLFFLGLLAKESTLTFLAVVPLTGYYFSRASWSRLGIFTGALVLVFLGYLALRVSVIGYLLSSGKEITDIMNNPFYGMSVGERLATIFYTLGLYIKLLFFPHPLTHDYYPYHIPIMNFADWQVWLSMLAYVGLAFLGIRGLRKLDIPSYGIWIYLATLSIVSNLPFSVGTFMNERFIFMPSVGFCIVLAWLLMKWLPEKVNIRAGGLPVVSLGLLAVFVIGFLIKTVTRVPAWKNRLALNAAAIQVSKNSARANLFTGTALYNEYKSEKDITRRQEMLQDINYYINRAVEINPKYGSAYKMKAGIEAENYKFDKDLDNLLNDFYQILQVRPGTDYIAQYTDYLIGREDPKKLEDFAFKVGRLMAEQVGQPSIAIKYFNFAIQADPTSGRSHVALADIYRALNQPVKANSFLQKGYSLDPSLRE